MDDTELKKEFAEIEKRLSALEPSVIGNGRKGCWSFTRHDLHHAAVVFLDAGQTAAVIGSYIAFALWLQDTGRVPFAISCCFVFAATILLCVVWYFITTPPPNTSAQSQQTTSTPTKEPPEI